MRPAFLVARMLRAMLAWLLVANAVVVGLFGLTATLFPGPLFDAFGGVSDVGSQFVMRLFGAALIGECLVRYGMRSVAPGDIRTALVNASVVEYVFAATAAVLAQATGVTNTAGIALVVLYGVFALGYAYIRFVPSSVART